MLNAPGQSVEDLVSVVFGLMLCVATTEHGPLIGVAYRLGCQGIHIEERLGSASCEYEGTWQKQERILHRAGMGLWYRSVSQCRRSNVAYSPDMLDFFRVVKHINIPQPYRDGLKCGCRIIRGVEIGKTEIISEEISRSEYRI